MSKDYYLLLTEDGLPVGSSITPNFPMLELPKCKVVQVVDKLEYDKVQEELGELYAEIIALKSKLDLAKSALNQILYLECYRCDKCD